MTTIDTRTAPRTSAHEAQQEDVAQHEDVAQREDPVRHEHAWATESRHPTSAGYVLYVRCTACGIHRVDLQARREAPPVPLSRVVGGAYLARKSSRASPNSSGRSSAT